MARTLGLIGPRAAFAFSNVVCVRLVFWPAFATKRASADSGALEPRNYSMFEMVLATKHDGAVEKHHFPIHGRSLLFIVTHIFLAS